MEQPNVISAINNIGFEGVGRRFAGFPDAPSRTQRIVEPRGLVMISLKAGDMVSIDLCGRDAPAVLCAFGEQGEDAAHLIGATSDAALDRSALDTHHLDGWVASNGGLAAKNFPCVTLPASDEALVFKAQDDCVLWIGNPVGVQALTGGQSVGAIPVFHTRSSGLTVAPDPIGRVVEEFIVARGSASAYELRKGQKVQVIDLEGQQCSDFQAFMQRDLDGGIEAQIDSTATRSMVRQPYPQPGLLDKFFDVDMRPMLRVVQDTCGRHDTFGLACTARGYEERGFPGHLNCSDNISNALQPYGVRRRSAWPAINLFWSTWINPHNQIVTEEGWSRPGDHVVMEAIDDLVCVSTACPDDIDPINGWNPTDVMVRIYDEEAPIARGIGYREREDGPMLVSEESAFHPRLAPLTEQFAPARDLWTPVSFPTHGTLGEYWACREKVTVQDMSSLRKYDIIGPDAERLLQMATTRNVSKLAQWRGQYTLMCDETGSVIDDGTLFRIAPELFRWCCGTEESGRALQALTDEHGLQVRINAMRNALPNLAIQGPNSRELMKRICFMQPHVPALDHLKWFGVSVARLNDRTGAPFMVSRTGYTGELGYEIFCGKDNAVEIWDAVMAAGQDLGITPMGSAALEIVRIEAGLAAAGAEFAPGVDAFEAGLGFAVDLEKTDFVGKAALERAKAAPSKVLKGLVLDCNDVPVHGAPVYSGERQVGVVTSATRSPSLENAVAIARLAVEFSENDTELEIGQLDGRMKRLTARVCAPAFVDPKRTRARA